MSADVLGPPGGDPAPQGGASSESLEAIGFPKGTTSEDVGYIQNKGWSGPSDMLKSYRATERLVGDGGPDGLIRIPSDPDNAELMGEFYNKLGRPGSPEDYKLADSLKVTDASQTLIGPAQTWFHEEGLTPRQATSLATKFNDHMDDLTAQEDERLEQIGVQQIESLKQKWGNEFDANVRRANAFNREFGITPEMIDQLDRSVGPGVYLDLAARVGKLLGEPSEAGNDNFNPLSGGTDIAKAKIEELQRDQAFMAAYGSGDKEAVARMERLYQAAFPGIEPGALDVRA